MTERRDGEERGWQYVKREGERNRARERERYRERGREGWREKERGVVN